MPDMADQLAGALGDVVRDVAGGTGPDTVLLVAEVGRPVTLGQGEGQAVVLAQQSSDFVDVLPQPGDGGFVPELDAFSTRYGALLEAATRRPALPDDVGAAVDAALAAARERYAMAAIPRLDVPQSLWPTRQQPAQWYHADGPHWQTLAVSEGDPPPDPRWTRYRGRWGWRTGSFDWSRHRTWRRDTAETMLRASDAQAAAPSPVDSDVRAQIRLVEDTDLQPTTSSAYRIDLAYTVVTLQRDWLETSWWSNPHWYVPGLDAAAWSAGDVRVADQLLAAVPVALVAVKDVVITAQWSGADSAVASTLPPALGPFSLAGARLESGRLEVAGIQVLAYLCKVPPPLPPAAPPPARPATEQPSAPNATGPPNAAGRLGLPELVRGDKGDAVRTLQGLLMARRGFPVDPGLLTGTFGPKTEAAVRALRGGGSDPVRVTDETWRVLLGL